MKIAILSCDAHVNNGWGVITLNYCRQLHDSGVDFTLFLPKNHSKINEAWEERVLYILPPLHLSYGSYRTIIDATFNLQYFSGYDLIHSLFAVPLSLIACRAATRYDVPFVMGAQGTYGIIPFLKWLDRKIFTHILERVDLFITPSNFTRRMMLSFYGKQKFKDKSIVIHNGIEFARFNSIWSAPEKKLKSEIKEFIGIGALKPRKGFDITIRAFQDVVKQNPNARYKIIGGGSKQYKNYLNDLIKSLKLEDFVTLKGEISGDELVNEMTNSYAYIHTPTSENWNFEGFGIVYVEANASGLPSIGSDSGGVPDAIIHGSSGLLTQEYDVRSTTEAINKMLQDKEMYKSMAENAVNWARKHDWNCIVKQYVECYKKLL